ncbi:Co/Zn/Cd efflux system membrane fusion protein [Aquipluma nitroreducens]|uniref:Co/Zn/Cd efflux system membrane fusion protein n=1 Tax=Aquipluma nitroreducens TaxID=2010828 RepID=A0A5K7SE61_9BACT|nr:efflux RND transporter periplasmic adaptor subunit [Aquipluma nitroreducens]BBE19902.1 Co/Zn/Cd efflux system membrane fusion protein [Aquipluma nitroreducens]
MKIFSNKYVRFSLILIGGILLGWIFFHSSPAKEEKHDHAAEVAKGEVWTCSMHPHIRMDKPGKCPICAMDLIPLTQSGTAEMDPAAVHLTKEAAQLANVLTSIVSRQNPEKEVRLYGKVQADERLLQNQVAHISGRVEKLFVNFTGEPVRKGQKLALIYSPELVTAQQELLEAAKTKLAQPEIYEAAKEKLRQWKLTDSQISAIESSGNVQANVEVESTTSGIITARRVNNGDYVSQGSVLYEVSDLSRVWLLFDAYESDLPFLKMGDKIDFSIQALPGPTFSGAIRFIDPVIDPVNRVAKVRVEISNPGAKLKPEMFATGLVKANLNEFKDKLVIPRSAVLWTGKRSIVYVKEPNSEEPVFKIREIELGPQLGNSYVVLDGLADGEEIVTQSAFSVDAAAQLEGKPSMMNPTGGKVSTGHDHGGMDMGGSKSGDMSGMDMGKGSEKANTQHQMVNISGNCDMCKERIETAAKSVPGVASAEWSAETKKLHVQFDGTKTNMDDIQKAIAKAGHDTEKYKASDAAYKALPECCLYRK